MPLGSLLLLLPALVLAAPPDDHLLPCGEPVVGVYYYPWFTGPPYRHVGWTPEFEYDNVGNPEHIAAVLRSLTDYGLNHAAFSYWDNAEYARRLERTFAANRALFAAGRRLYLSPYLEPPTIDKRFGEAEAIAANVDFIADYLGRFAGEPAFARVGGHPLTNIYVTYEVPTSPAGAFRSWLERRYGGLAKLNAAWGTELAEWPDRAPAPGTLGHVDWQTYLAERLVGGWETTRREIRRRTGETAHFTGDNSRTITGLRTYLQALGGLTWYSYRQAIGQPYTRPKACSDLARAAGAHFFYTISPGYVDRQQRWPGARIEREPALYEYNWCQALSTRPDGILILTHSEWYEGSIIDVTREYGKQAFETTELYASLYKAGFRDSQRRKLAPKPLAVIYNEYAPFRLRSSEQGIQDVYGLIALAEASGHEFDVVAESDLGAASLAQRRTILLPSCGAGLAPTANETLLAWVRGGTGRTLLVTGCPWWDKALEAGGQPVERPEGRGRVLYTPEPLGTQFEAARAESARQLRLPRELLATWLGKLALGTPPHSTDIPEIKVLGSFMAGDSLVLPVSNVLGWGDLAQEGGVQLSHSADDIRPREPRPTTFSVNLKARRGYEPAEVMAVDADSGRFQMVPSQRRGDQVVFTWPVDTHAVFVLPDTMFRLTWPRVARVVAGGEVTLEVNIGNPSGGPASGMIAVAGGPGLSSSPVQFACADRGNTTVPVTIRTDPTYATGQRTIRVTISGDGRNAVFWRPLECLPPALIGSRTAVVGGPAGQSVNPELVLCNVGQAAAEEVTVELAGHRVPAEQLEPGAETAIRLPVDLPPAEPAPPFHPLTLRWSAADGADGISQLSGGDGVSRAIERLGRPCRVPDEAAGPTNRYLYFRVDETRLPPGPARRARLTVTFADLGSDRFDIHYDGGRAGDPLPTRYRDGGGASLTASGRWRTVDLELPDATFAKGQNLGADFRVVGLAPLAAVELTLLPPEPPAAEKLTALVRYTSAGQPHEQRLTLRRAGLPVGDDTVVVVNPTDTARLPAVEARLPWPADRPAPTLLGPTERPLPARLNQGRLEFCLPLTATATPVRLVADGPPAPRLTVRQGQGLVIVDTGPAQFVWDEDRSGALVALVDRRLGLDHAAHPGGAVGLKWTPLGGAERDWAAPVRLHVADDGYRATVRVSGEADGFRIEDVWTVVAGANYARLSRTVTPLGNLTLADFTPLFLRCGKRHLPRIYPLGVGNTWQGEGPVGQLETWAVARGYIALDGSPQRSGSAAGLVILEPERVRRIRYGYFGDEVQLRLRGERRLSAGRPLTLNIAIFCGSGLDWRYPEALWHLLTGGPQIVTDGVTGGIQRPVPRAPTYLFDIQEPRP